MLCYENSRKPIICDAKNRLTLQHDIFAFKLRKVRKLTELLKICHIWTFVSLEMFYSKPYNYFYVKELNLKFTQELTVFKYLYYDEGYELWKKQRLDRDEVSSGS